MIKITNFLKFEEVIVTLNISLELRRNFVIRNKKEEIIGYINWFQSWKRYVFTAASGSIVWDIQCLTDVIQFMEEIK